MSRRIIVVSILILLSVNSHAAYYISNYSALMNSFEKEKEQINKNIDNENKRFISSLRNYQSYKSDRWRTVFTTVVSEIDARRLALDSYKREALERSGVLNKEWLTEAKNNNISQVSSEQDISDFYYWYNNNVEL